MRIAIDARQIVRQDIGRVSGVSQYTSHIIHALARLATNDDLLLFMDADVPAETVSWLVNGNARVTIKNDAVPLSAVPLVGHHLMLPTQIHSERVDVFFSPTGLLPLGLRTPSVAFIHDLLILKHPEWFPDTALQQLFTLRLVLPRSLSRARRLLVPSVSVRRDLVEELPDAAGKTTVIHEGIDPKDPAALVLTEATREAHGIRGVYIISVATIEPRKNLTTSLKAFEGLLTASPGLARSMQYVMVGSLGWGSEAVSQEVEDMNKRWRQYNDQGVVRLLTQVTDEEKWALYAHAELYLATSLAEGFGLPPLEAMSVGTPVITTRVGALPEYAEGAVIFVEPLDAAGITRQMDRLLRDAGLRAQLREKGIAAAKALTWEQAAQKTLAVLKEVGSL